MFCKYLVSNIQTQYLLNLIFTFFNVEINNKLKKIPIRELDERVYESIY